ncbi:patatin-like phospholipase family protein [Marinicella sp. S1101]|uniref:patatin-like phospholipase family protein n=1 Tax=Marinicella marina TaxID=2996016 RepID=UPI0022608E92|nr:patatin-like phospholipase family protein [Marinicella marina]MCX7552709.1 patatin-like phospholipase family protein [Marinicella marina]MDJ1139982.1 patatin-like phospholipase family protein [Marinicella marina]
MPLHTKLLMLCLLLLIPSIAAAKERPKIGLALSGGGARGMAHVGVLKALEEKNIPIDYIAGTSMGSIVGGLYATGMSPEDLEWAIQSVDWDDALKPSPKRKLKDYQQRQEEKDYFADLEIGISKEGAKSGTGLAGDHKVMLELQRLVGTFNEQDFNQFPIPYRAVTTDLNEGEPYVIEHGDLAMAMRASMAVPLVFGPVKHQGRMLVDGGMLNNLPVDVVRAMGADIVIAVNISSPLAKVNEESSVLAVTYQSIDVALVQNTKRSLKQADIVIQPELEGIDAGMFNRAEDMINDGYLSTYAISEKLHALRLPEHQYITHLESRNFLPREIPSRIRYVEFTGNKRTSSSRLMAKADELIGQEFKAKLVQDFVDQVVAKEEDIQVITYHVAENDEKNKGIVFKVQEKRWGPDYLKFGLKVADDFDSNTLISLLVRHHRYNINSKGGRWINDLSIGSILSWQSELYQPLDFESTYFATANIDTIKDTRRFYNGLDATGEYDHKKFGFGFNLGYNPDINSELRAGIWYLDESIVPVINDIDFETAINRTIGLKVNYGYDTLDKVIGARNGYDIKAELGIFDRVQFLSFDGFKRFPFFEKSAAHLRVKFDFTDLVDNDEYFKAYGGIDDFAGYPTQSLLGLNAFLFELGWYTPFSSLDLPIIGAPDLTFKTHWGNVWQRNINIEDMIYGFSAGVSFDVQDTVMFLGTGYSHDGEARFYLRLGTGF